MRYELPEVDIVPSVLLDIDRQFKDVSGKRERCGILLGRRTEGGYHVWRFVPVKNSGKAAKFKVTSAHARKALGLKRDEPLPFDLVGVVHTHNEDGHGHSDPSWDDVAFLPDDKIGMVYHVPTATLTCYTHGNGYVKKYSRERGWERL